MLSVFDVAHTPKLLCHVHWTNNNHNSFLKLPSHFWVFWFTLYLTFFTFECIFYPLIFLCIVTTLTTNLIIQKITQTAFPTRIYKKKYIYTWQMCDWSYFVLCKLLRNYCPIEKILLNWNKKNYENENTYHIFDV